ncbi:MAG: hypothetical protein GXY98_07775 [Erysipelothrix sp.]|nr:hypothetical protein [Erysipelothrix sp.]
MKRFIKIIALIVCFLLLSGFSQLPRKSLFRIGETITFHYKANHEMNIIITEEIKDDQIIIREYHNENIIDESIYQFDEYHGLSNPVVQIDSKAIVPLGNPHLSGTKALGSIYYNVQGYSKNIKVDVRYKQYGAPQQTTKRINGSFGSVADLASFLASELFLPKVVSGTLANKIIIAGSFAWVAGRLIGIGSPNVAVLAQNEFVYAYTPYQPPYQAEYSVALTGTKYTVNESSHWSTGSVLYSGYSSAGWKDHSMGILTGNHFFPTYYQIASWQ